MDRHEHETQIRQGDLLFVKRRELPHDAVPLPDQQRARILAEGEKSGHTHTATAGTVYSNRSGKFIKLDKAAEVRHQEHRPVSLGPGVWEVIQQLQYVPPPPAQRAPIETPGHLTPMPEHRRSSMLGDLVDSLGSTRRVDD